MLRINKTGWLCLVIMMIGGINWGLVGFFEYNLVTAIFSARPMLARIVFSLVGIATLYVLFEVLHSLKMGFAEKHKPHPA